MFSYLNEKLSIYEKLFIKFMISKLNIISNRNLGVFFDIYAITAIKVNIKKEKIAMIRRTM